MMLVIVQCWSLQTWQSKGKAVMMKMKRLIFFFAFFFRYLKSLDVFDIIYSNSYLK
eukprot:UN00653